MKTQVQQPKASETVQPKAEKQASVETILAGYNSPLQRKTAEEEPLQKKENNTGLPDNLKSGVENLSGYTMDDVNVHYNSSQPAEMQAHAYAQGTDIHVAPGQEQHLPHEAWHVVQQKQGRVKPTMQMKGKVNINDDAGLETEADVMGAKSLQMRKDTGSTLDSLQLKPYSGNSNAPVQRVLTIDNADFSGVNDVKNLGGAAEGAFLISDGPGKIVIKIADGIDSTVMAYNLAKDFGVATPKGRYMDLSNESGKILKKRAVELNTKDSIELAGKLNTAKGITIWSLVEGDTIDKYKQKKGDESEAGIDKEESFKANPENFIEIGRMFVYDMAILNIDRFRLGTEIGMNAGNIMIENDKPVAIDQDFANIDKKDSKPNQQLNTYKTFMNDLIVLLKNPAELASQLCLKLVYIDEMPMFDGKENEVEIGIKEGIDILRGLASDSNSRLADLIAWTKTFRPDTDLDVANIKTYWKSLLPEVEV